LIRTAASVSCAVAMSLAACGDSTAPPVPRMTEPAQAYDPADPPVLLTGSGLGAMESLVSGTLVRQGPCLTLDPGSEPAVILWGEDIQVETKDNGKWSVLDRSTGTRIAPGDRVRGGGGRLPPERPISDFVVQPVPEECATGPAMQLYGLELLERADRKDAARLPSPPSPPPPPPPSIIDHVKNEDRAIGGSVAMIRSIDDPREALFGHVIEQARAEEGNRTRPACLRQTDPEMLARLSRRFDGLYAAKQCRWNDGGVVLRATDEPAFFVDARIECDGQECAAEGAVVYGNQGGEGYGYSMEPTSGGWIIRSSGISWIS